MADKEYIERGALIAEYDRVHVGAPGGARKLMVDAPTADVVEVVRCKDCAWSRMVNVNGKPEYYCQCWNPGNVIHVDARGFCMWGERREQT